MSKLPKRSRNEVRESTMGMLEAASSFAEVAIAVGKSVKTIRRWKTIIEMLMT